MQIFGIISLFTAVIFFVSPAHASCPIERARYRMIHHSDFTAGFYPLRRVQDAYSDLVFFLHVAPTNETYWFKFERGSAPYIDLIPADVLGPRWSAPFVSGRERPLYGMNIMLATRGYRFVVDIPDRRWKRPTYLLLPDLPENFRTSLHASAPLDLFRFDHCTASDHEAY
jgi:hypothetical protein